MDNQVVPMTPTSESADPGYEFSPYTKFSTPCVRYLRRPWQTPIRRLSNLSPTGDGKYNRTHLSLSPPEVSCFSTSPELKRVVSMPDPAEADLFLRRVDVRERYISQCSPWGRPFACLSKKSLSSSSISSCPELSALMPQDSEPGSPRPRRQMRFVKSNQWVPPPGALNSPTLRVSPKAVASNKVHSPIQIETLFLTCFFLDGRELTRFSEVSKAWFDVVARQPVWQELVLKEFGFKYENYALYTKQDDWRRLYAKIATFMTNLRRGTPKRLVHKQVISKDNDPNYEGCMAITPDSKTLLLENGKELQAIDLLSGVELFKVPIGGPRETTSRPYIVNTNSYVFVHLNGSIHVHDMKTGAFKQVLHVPEERDLASSDFYLDIEFRNSQLAFLTSTALYIWDSETLEYLFKIQHKEVTVAGVLKTDLDFLWAGYNSCSRQSGGETSACRQSLCQRRSNHIITWLKRSSANMQIHDTNSGRYLCTIEGHKSPILRVRQATNIYDGTSYFLASLDAAGDIRIWTCASVATFNFICVISTGQTNVFRFSMTTNKVFIMSESSDDQNSLSMWDFCPYDTKIISPADDRGTAQRLSPSLRLTSGRVFFDADRMQQPPSPSAAFQTVASCLATASYCCSGKRVLSNFKTISFPKNLYFCDVIDNKLIGLWYSTYRPGSTEISLSQSNWEVYDLAPESPKRAGNRSSPVCFPLSPGSNRRYAQSSNAFRPEQSDGDRLSAAERAIRNGRCVGDVRSVRNLLGRRTFRMFSRADTWTVLDWKSISIMADGTVVVYDFCPPPELQPGRQG